MSIRAKRTAAALAAVGGMALASGCGAAVQGGSSSDTYTIGLVTSQTGAAGQSLSVDTAAPRLQVAIAQRME